MSWSVCAVGTPAAVKDSIRKQFAEVLPRLKEQEQLKHEHASAALALESIEAQMNFLIDNEIKAGVKVEANGHAWVSAPNGATGLHVNVATIPNFVG